MNGGNYKTKHKKNQVELYQKSLVEKKDIWEINNKKEREMKMMIKMIKISLFKSIFSKYNNTPAKTQG